MTYNDSTSLMIRELRFESGRKLLENVILCPDFVDFPVYLPICQMNFFEFSSILINGRFSISQAPTRISLTSVAKTAAASAESSHVASNDLLLWASGRAWQSGRRLAN